MSDFRPPDSLITKVSHRSMATDFVVMLPSHWSGHVEAVLEALESLDAIESRLTIYRDDSEIAQVNRSAADQPVQLSQPTFDLLQRAIEWSRRTNGAFDVTAGPLVEAWGFTQRSGRKPSAEQIDQARHLVGYEGLQLTQADRTVRFTRPGMSINLGAIGKGDALDRLAADLRGQGIEDFLIHGGNSSVIAVGNQNPSVDSGWPIGIAHPTKSERRLGGVWLKDTALATSGSGKQFFHHRGKRYGHVIDPRTGYPAGDLLALTVLMPSAADADACATGMFVMGSEEIDSPANQAWVPPRVAVKQGPRQDEAEWTTAGDVDWIEEA